MSRIRLSAPRWIFRITAIWHSVLLWMRWRRNRRAREEQYLEVLDRLMVAQVQSRQELRRLREELAETKHQLQDSQFRVLMSALRPLAEAMQRQDSLHLKYHKEQEVLLLEVLNSLQPSAREQISQQIGLPTLPPSFPSLVS